MAKPTNIQRAFLAGVRHGYRLGRKETKRDVEDPQKFAPSRREPGRLSTTPSRPSATPPRG
jgi:hypothetical protein